MTHPFPVLSGGQQVLPTQEQFAKWDSEYFDEEGKNGERQNFDIMMIKAFQAGADKQLEQAIEWLNDNADMLIVSTQSELATRYLESLEKEFIQDFKKAMRPWEES